MSVKIKFTTEEVREIIRLLGYILISKEYLGSKKELIIKDKEGYYYSTTLMSIYNHKQNPSKFSKGNKYTIQNIKLWLILTNSQLSLVSDKYVGSENKLIFKDINNYFYYSSLHGLFDCIIPDKFNKSNPFTIQNIKLWCKLNNKKFELISNNYYGSDILLQWRCLKEECGEIFESNWGNIYGGNRGCPFCRGLKVGLSNCLATKNPILAKEWHPTKNGDLTPFDVTWGSGKYIWWECSKNSKHEWQAKVTDRHDNGCPYCRGYYPSEDHNLLFNNPKLCEEWNYDKNDKAPSEYTPNTDKYAWWKCKECDHEWKDTINHRNNGNRGCPQCNKSKGEKRCKEVFISYSFFEISQKDYKLLNKNDNTYFIPQQKFDGLVGLGGGKLSYDFYLPKYNILIEYQGEFHDGTANIQTDEEFIIQQEHDRRKKEYAEKHGIRLLAIWYYDFNNIEIILEKAIGGEK